MTVGCRFDVSKRTNHANLTGCLLLLKIIVLIVLWKSSPQQVKQPGMGMNSFDKLGFAAVQHDSWNRDDGTPVWKLVNYNVSVELPQGPVRYRYLVKQKGGSTYQIDMGEIVVWKDRVFVFKMDRQIAEQLKKAASM